MIDKHLIIEAVLEDMEETLDHYELDEWLNPESEKRAEFLKKNKDPVARAQQNVEYTSAAQARKAERISQQKANKAAQSKIDPTKTKFAKRNKKTGRVEGKMTRDQYRKQTAGSGKGKALLGKLKGRFGEVGKHIGKYKGRYAGGAAALGAAGLGAAAYSRKKRREREAAGA